MNFETPATASGVRQSNTESRRLRSVTIEFAMNTSFRCDVVRMQAIWRCAILLAFVVLAPVEASAQETWRDRIESWLGTAPPQPTTDEQEEAVDDLVEAIQDRDVVNNVALGAFLDPGSYDPRNNLITIWTDNVDKYLDRVALIAALLSALPCPGQFAAVLAAADDPCVRFDFFIGVF